MIRKSSLPLVGILVGLSVIGVLVAVSVDDYGSCGQSSSEVYLVTIADGSSYAPLHGVEVSGNIQRFCQTDVSPGYIIQSSSIKAKTTPLNGTLKLGTSIGNYSLSVHYLNENYPVYFSRNDDLPYLLKLSLPSGRLSIVECPTGLNSFCLNQSNSNSSASA